MTVNTRSSLARRGRDDGLTTTPRLEMGSPPALAPGPTASDRDSALVDSRVTAAAGGGGEWNSQSPSVAQHLVAMRVARGGGNQAVGSPGGDSTGRESLAGDGGGASGAEEVVAGSGEGTTATRDSPSVGVMASRIVDVTGVVPPPPPVTGSTPPPGPPPTTDEVVPPPPPPAADSVTPDHDEPYAAVWDSAPLHSIYMAPTALLDWGGGLGGFNPRDASGRALMMLGQPAERNVSPPAPYVAVLPWRGRVRAGGLV